MTIKQKAREIAEKAAHFPLPTSETAARLGIIEGLEMAVAIVQTARFTNPESLRDSIADAILDLIKEYEK